MARAELATATIKVYLAGVRHAQIMRGFPEPSHSGSLPRLKLVQAGVAHARLTQQPTPTPRQRLPITIDILHGLLDTWSRPLNNKQTHDRAMLRAAATACFFGFFRSGEITAPSVAGFNEWIHLGWGDVATDEGTPPSILRVHLKQSKCDQLGNGVDVYIGSTGARVCPVVFIRAHAGGRFGDSEVGGATWDDARTFLSLRGRNAFDEGGVRVQDSASSGVAGLGSPSVRRPQLPNRRRHSRREGGAGRFSRWGGGTVTRSSVTFGSQESA